MPVTTKERIRRKRPNPERLALIKQRHRELVRRQSDVIGQELELFEEEEIPVAGSFADE